MAYQGHDMQFRDDGWLNATSVALKFDKDPYHWLRQVDVLEYICALADDDSNSSFLEEFNEINELYKGKSESPAAQAKRLRKGVPLLVGNIGPDTFGQDDNALLLLDESGSRELPRDSKLALARKLIAEIALRISTRTE